VHFSCTGMLHACIVAMSHHSPCSTCTPWHPLQVITTGALIMELAAALVLGITVLTYDYFSSEDSSYLAMY
jgi:hypothetical protein